MVAVPANEKDDLRRVLDENGAPLPGARIPSISDATLSRMFEVMLLTRIIDDRMSRLARDGGAAFYRKSIGEAASHFAAAPLRDSDWVFPSYREHGVWLWRGYSLQQYVDQLLGNAGDPSKGRQTPTHHAARWLNLVSISSPVGTQIPQATGAAYAARAQGKDDVVMTFFGEAATSTGEFHVGMNFAAVWKAPCVFVCRSNGWTGARRGAGRTFAYKALGYGMPGVRVDGNDALAVWQVASEAIDRARGGGGPTLIEALTYRIQGHTSSGDPALYRKEDPPENEPESPAAWQRRDPLRRLRGYLQHRALWSTAWEAEIAERCAQQVSDALAAAEAKPAPAVETLFDDVYEQLPWHLREQRAELLALPRTSPRPSSSIDPSTAPVSADPGEPR